jgi:acyl-CoA synthetase (AMP-forming)/AMP-acid ligase II
LPGWQNPQAMEQTMQAESISHWLEAVVAEHGPRNAIIFLRNGQTETQLTYGQLHRDVNRLANALLDFGVQKGDRVILFIPKSVIAVVAHFALLTIGAMAVPLNPGFKKNEMAYLLGDAEAKLVLVEPENKTLVRDIDPHLRLLEITTAKPYQDIDFFRSAPPTVPAVGITAADPALVIYTSGSIGLPLPGLQVRIVDPESFTDVAPGQVGEIWLKSTAIIRSYWRKPLETADTFKDGWFRTGDLGKVDTAGYYYLTDRIKHIIITGGENVSAKEVETIINQLDGVNESVVVGKPDDKWGEKAVAAVTLKPDAELSESAIQAYCKKHLHDWKCPKQIVFLDEIPRNTMGKVLKEEVKKRFLST